MAVLQKKRTVADPLSVFLKSAVAVSAAVTFLALFFIVAYILVKGLPHLKPDLFDWTYTQSNASLTPALINTFLITLISLIAAVPAGLATAVYLSEYSKPTSRINAFVRLSVQTLSGVPSIVYGLFGFLFFVAALGMGYSVLAGSLTLAVMILPLIIRSGEEALSSVPLSLREGSFALGAGKLRTVFRVVAPAAMPGIIAGIILGIGRIFGETAALIYTSGTVAEAASSLGASGRTLSVHMYALSSEGLYTDQAYATAVVLLVSVAFINFLSAWAARKTVK